MDRSFFHPLHPIAEQNPSNTENQTTEEENENSQHRVFQQRRIHPAGKVKLRQSRGLPAVFGLCQNLFQLPVGLLKICSDKHSPPSKVMQNVMPFFLDSFIHKNQCQINRDHRIKEGRDEQLISVHNGQKQPVWR